jgi:oxygen-independent coproporphyrinogen-3 oxidase
LFIQNYNIEAKTIYFGGGTPSLLPPDYIKEIIHFLPKSNDCEITLEANPGTLNCTLLNELKNSGINRISLGIQSLNPYILNYLGRIHTVNQAKDAISMIKDTGFENYSIDLIYGIPNQSVNDFLSDINYCISEKIPHISFYCLSLDEDSKLYQDSHKLPNDNLISKMYYSALAKLKKAKYVHYEISNFSLPEFESKHNNSYWTGAFYIGLGPSASGYLPAFRYTNPASLHEYDSQIKNNQICTNKDHLADDDLEKEYIITRLRLKSGIDLNDYSQKFSVSFCDKYSHEIEYLKNLNMIKINKKNLYINEKALLVSNEIILKFI